MSKFRDAPFAKKSFGQNLLIDQNIIDKIIKAANPGSTDTAVEIGPGRGALTEKLLNSAGEVIAIELERDMASLLREKFADRSNFHLVEADAVNLDFASVLGPEQTPAKLVANLPYNVSTAILQSLAEQKDLFSEMVLMFQREVAERITAKPGTSERGFLTVIVEANFNVEWLFDVPPAAFRPIPKVWSSVVKLTPKFVEIANGNLFRKLVSVGFAQRRKTIQNNLKTLYSDAPGLLERSNIEPNRRAETLTLEEWLNLARTVS
jgi:16S rRNA (adenine1518-N6/adenine1519-N6)-dimethyltransferase